MPTGTRILGMLMGCALLAGIVPAPARAADDVVLYEVTESVRMQGSFKSSRATLTGRARMGTVLCPERLAALSLRNSCSVTVIARGQANDDTGQGPVQGLFYVTVQDDNQVDAPELVVVRGTLNGEIDLSAAFVGKVPRGSISGHYSFRGAGMLADDYEGGGRFEGRFRIPFLVDDRPHYLSDDDTPTPVEAAELSLGQAAVRLDLTLLE
jgi:hypothetical protein